MVRLEITTLTSRSSCGLARARVYEMLTTKIEILYLILVHIIIVLYSNAKEFSIIISNFCPPFKINMWKINFLLFIPGWWMVKMCYTIIARKQNWFSKLKKPNSNFKQLKYSLHREWLQNKQIRAHCLYPFSLFGSSKRNWSTRKLVLCWNLQINDTFMLAALL